MENLFEEIEIVPLHLWHKQKIIVSPHNLFRKTKSIDIPIRYGELEIIYKIMKEKE